MPGAHLTKPALYVAAATLLLLLVPMVAMQFTSEVSWGPGDFLAAATLLFSAGMVYTIWARYVRTRQQRVLVGFVVFAVLATVWAELAVGLFT
jgi:Kef-type K+ transport system membrane component KefB